MINAGYALEVTSWENDADYYNTIRIDGLGSKDAKWLVYFLQEINKQKPKYGGGWGMTESIAEDIYTSVTAKLGYPYKGEIVPLDEVYDFISDLAYSLLGPPYEYTGYMRKVDNVSVYLIPADLPDMAKDFLA